MAFNLSIEQQTLVDEYRHHLNSEDARQALDELITRAKIDTAFEFIPTGHGNITRTVKYVRISDGAWAYGFIVNRASILFYYRNPSGRVSDALASEISSNGLETSRSGMGEIKVRISGAKDVQFVLDDCFPIDVKGELPNLMVLEAKFHAQVTASLNTSSQDRSVRLATATKLPQRVEVATYAYLRNPDVVAEVLLRANGNCEACHAAAPFMRRKDGTPYLEVHHRLPLALGGEDTVENAMAVCPNCHREKHHG